MLFIKISWNWPHGNAKQDKNVKRLQRSTPDITRDQKSLHKLSAQFSWKGNSWPFCGTRGVLYQNRSTTVGNWYALVLYNTVWNVEAANDVLNIFDVYLLVMKSHILPYCSFKHYLIKSPFKGLISFRLPFLQIIATDNGSLAISTSKTIRLPNHVFNKYVKKSEGDWRTTYILISIFQILFAGLECSHRMRNVGCSNPSRDRPLSLKHVVTAPLLYARQ